MNLAEQQERPTGYALSRQWFDYCFENPDRVRPIHSAIYFFIIEWCNRLGWKDRFGLPSAVAMETLGMKSYNTYVEAFRELVDFGVIEVIERSKNQHSANIVALSNIDKASNKALDKALATHIPKHLQRTGESRCKSNRSINKHSNIEQVNHKPLNRETASKDQFTFDDFWNLYEKKVGDKEKIGRKWAGLSLEDRKKIFVHVPLYKEAQPDKRFRKDPATYLNQKAWNDEIIERPKPGGGAVSHPAAKYDNNKTFSQW